MHLLVRILQESEQNGIFTKGFIHKHCGKEEIISEEDINGSSKNKVKRYYNLIFLKYNNLLVLKF